MQNKYLFSLLFLFSICCQVFSQNPQENGQWSNPIPFDVIPVAMANLPDGRILVWSSKYHDNWGGGDGFTFTQIFDPSIGIDGGVLPRTVTQTDHDMFCPGINNLADGRILATGGSSSERSSIYNPETETWTRADDMNIPRGYQGAVTLSDGSAFVLGGSWNGGLGNKDAEIWKEETGWSLLPGIKNEVLWNANDESLEPQGVFRIDNHQWFWAAPNGKIFHAGPGEMMHWIDVSGNGSVSTIGKRGNDIYSMNGNTVMFDIGKILKVGGSYTYDSGTPSNEKSYVIDFNDDTNVQVIPTANNMHNYRTFSTSIVLPSGDVVVLGGMETSLLFSDVGAYLTAEIYNSDTNTFKTVAGMQIPRTYHSTGILMSDGRVFMGGGGLCGDCGDVNHMDAEIFSPPYLFDHNGSLAQRPTLVAPEEAFYNGQLEVTASEDVTEFAFVRMSSSTHSLNNEQRRVPVSYTVENDKFTISMPEANLMPPGYYMLFALNSNGVPSMSEAVLVGPDLACSVNGTTCDDDNPLTLNDLSDGECNCEGTQVICEDLTVVYEINGEIAELESEINIYQGSDLGLFLNIENVAFTILDPEGIELTNNLINNISTVQSGIYTLMVPIEDASEGSLGIICELEVQVNVSPEIIPVTSINLNVDVANLTVGEELQLSKNVLPSNATDKTVVWASTDESIVIVNEFGLVSAIAVGEAIIGVTTNDGAFTASTAISVLNSVVAVSDINIDIVNASIFINDELNLTATVLPINATNKNISWSSAQPSIANVDATGRVTGLAKGEAIISALSEEGSISTFATIKVTSVADVKMQMSPNPAASVIYVYFNSSSPLDIIAFNIFDDNNTNVKELLDPDLLLVEGGNYRLVIADLPNGIYTVEGVTSHGIFQEELTVYRNIPVDSISLDVTEASLEIGETLTLVSAVTPIDATDKGIVWSSSDEAKATVDATGIVTAISEGEVVITATTVDGGFTATSTITVTTPVIFVEGISLDVTEASLEIGETLTLISAVTPVDATDKGIVWSSSDEAKATVDATGIVTAITAGEVVITASTVDGGFTASVTITVVADPVSDVNMLIGPNPADYVVYVYFGTSNPLEITSLNIYDSNNILVKTFNDPASILVDGGNYRLVISDLPVGSYTLEGVSTTGSYQKELTIEREVILVTGISFDVTEASVQIADAIKINSIIAPTSATNKAITWSSTDETIATVDDSGNVFGLSEGVVVITATTVDGGFIASATITVTTDPVSDVVMLIGPNPADYLVYVYFGTSNPLEITSLNIYDSNNILVKTFNDPASILVDGGNYRLVISDLPVGSYTLEGVSTTGSYQKELTIEREVILVTGISFDVTEASVQIADAIKINSIIAPTSATNKAITWSSTDETIATVDDSGNVFGLSEGDVVITATTVDGGFIASATITVTTDPVSDVVMLVGPNPANFVVYVYFGTSNPLEITALNIYDANNVLVKTFSDPASILVDGGNYRLVISDLPVGSYTLEGVSTAGSYQKELTIEREVILVTGISFDVTDASVQISEELYLATTILPNNATNKGLIWSTEDETIATIDTTGKITGISEGEVDITVTTMDGSFVATASISVTTDPVPNITMLVAPNPASYVFYVYFSSPDPVDILIIHIYDSLGRLVKTFDNPASVLVDGGNYRLLVNDLPAGNYFIEGVTSGGNIQKQAVIGQ